MIHNTYNNAIIVWLTTAMFLVIGKNSYNVTMAFSVVHPPSSRPLSCRAMTKQTPMTRNMDRDVTLALSSSSSDETTNNKKKKTTLTEETTWKLTFVLQGIKTAKGRKVEEYFTIKVKFIESEELFEPPEGTLQQVDIDNENVRFKIRSSRWKLSEDPNERKDGLWVWGLFQEPLYPFLLLQLETEPIELILSGNGGGDDDDDNEKTTNETSGDVIPALQLYAQLDHGRDKELGVILKGNTIKIRKVETFDADPFGAATVDLYEEVSVGKLSIQAQ